MYVDAETDERTHKQFRWNYVEIRIWCWAVLDELGLFRSFSEFQVLRLVRLKVWSTWVNSTWVTIGFPPYPSNHSLTLLTFNSSSSTTISLSNGWVSVQSLCFPSLIPLLRPFPRLRPSRGVAILLGRRDCVIVPDYLYLKFLTNGPCHSLWAGLLVAQNFKFTLNLRSHDSILEGCRVLRIVG